MTTETKIEVKLVPSNYLTRWPCHACGGHTDKVYILAEAEDEHGRFRVCENCLKAGASEIDARLEAHAQRLETLATMTRAMIGRLVVPSYEEWRASDQAVDDAIAAEHDAWYRSRSDALAAQAPPMPDNEVPF